MHLNIILHSKQKYPSIKMRLTASDHFSFAVAGRGGLWQRRKTTCLQFIASRTGRINQNYSCHRFFAKTARCVCWKRQRKKKSEIFSSWKMEFSFFLSESSLKISNNIDAFKYILIIIISSLVNII